MIKLFKRLGDKFYMLFRVYYYWSVVLKQWFSGKYMRHLFLPFVGFEPNKGVLYPEMTRANRKDYVSDYFRWVTSYKINNPYKYFFMDKLNFFFFIKSFSDKVCPVLGYYSKEGSYTEIMHPEAIPFSFDKIIYKPNKGTKGGGIEIAPRHDSSGKKYRDYIACPFLVQDNYASKIFPDALNTIRVFTGILDRKAVCICAVHRFGRKGVKGVDNFSQGGISALINLQDGKMVKACYFNGKERVSVDTHPDTGSPIVGVTVEGWREMLAEILELQQRIAFIRYLAWDIAMVNGSYSIIEANHVSDVDLYQCHGPIMTDANQKRFFSQYK